ncbi:mechanosensitive ion channel family protein [Desulfovibrio ferrophilus]|nr:mechanosensitive ion channel family protein [Desulfovibrio ferrophilus]
MAVAVLATFVVVSLFLKWAVVKLEGYYKSRGIVLDEGIRADFSRSFKVVVLGLVLFVLMREISFGPVATRYVSYVLLIGITLMCISLVYNFVRGMLDFSLKRKGLSLDEHSSRVLLPVVKAIAWIVALAFLLDNFGFKISTILAGLGVAGVAVGFAAQAVLGDLFSYFAILFDRPFRIGDFIVLDTLRGNIEHIGLKTTRIRSLDGEQIVLSNSDLTGSRVHNYRRMTRRRVLFGFGVVYQTPAAKVEAIPGLVRAVIENVDLATCDRAHFKQFGAFSLDFEVVFYVESPDYGTYMDIQQTINLGLMKTFEAQGIAFAYPTQKIYMTSEEENDA